MSKDAAAHKETKIIELQKAQTDANASCNEEIGGLKKDLDALRAGALTGG